MTSSFPPERPIARGSIVSHLEDTAANVRPIIRETSRLPQSYSIAVGAKRKKCTSTAGRVSRSATAFISAFSAKFGLRVILLSAVRFAAGGRRAAGSRNPKPAWTSSPIRLLATGQTLRARGPAPGGLDLCQGSFNSRGAGLHRSTAKSVVPVSAHAHAGNGFAFQA